MLAHLHPVRDMRLSGQVIYVGKSSMEVAVRMEALNPDGSEETVMLGMILRSSPQCASPIFDFRAFLYGMQR